MASAEDIAAIFAAVTKEMKKGVTGRGYSRRLIDEQSFRRVDNFGGEDRNGKD